MTAALTKTLHSQHTFACETRVPVLKIVATTLKLATVAALAALVAAGFAFAFLAREPVVFFVVLGGALFVAVFAYELLTGKRVSRIDAPPTFKDDADWSQRTDRYYNPDNHHNPNR